LLAVGFSVKAGTDAIAVGVRPGKVLAPSASTADRGGMLTRVLARSTVFDGDDDDVLPVCTPDGWIVLVGLGAPADDCPARLRRIGGTLLQSLADTGIDHLDVMLDLGPADAAQVAYGMRLRSWRPDPRYRTKPDPDQAAPLASATMICADPGAAEAAYRPLGTRADAADFVRDLVVAPANRLTPAQFVQRLGQLTALGVTVEDIDLAATPMPLLQAVGRGSAEAPRLVTLSWPGRPARTAAPIVLVGKGITFDAGGLSIKAADEMEEMKGDMAGAAAVAGAIWAAAARSAAQPVVGVLALAENMPSGRACRPGDVVVGRAGLSVEIVDADAEGRLILADALSFAAERFRPALMIDLATLTGAVETALGDGRAGLFSNDDDLATRLLAAGEDEEERLWRLPLTDVYDSALKSDIADLRNCDWADDSPDALHAARFLEHFVPEGLPWAHLDIAGVTEAEEDGPLATKGPTAFGVRLLDRLVGGGE
jgi:leucyl aminopeptidase